MATTHQDFVDILTAEQLIDIDRLKQAAWHGIPEQVRGLVWSKLLGVDSTSTQSLMVANQVFKTENNDGYQVQGFWGSISRYCSARRQTIQRRMPIKDFESCLQRVLSVHLSHNRANPSVDLVPLCAPFVFSMQQEQSVRLAFEKLLVLIDDYYATHSLNDRISNFLLLFRTLLPDLYNNFADEEVHFKEWATSWFEYLLAKELSLECVSRLWDTYFSSNDGIELHVYVCLAILSHLKEDLEDLEQSEIHSVLQRLPPIDMDMIISHALRIRYEVIDGAMAL